MDSSQEPTEEQFKLLLADISQYYGMMGVASMSNMQIVGSQFGGLSSPPSKPKREPRGKTNRKMQWPPRVNNEIN